LKKENFKLPNSASFEKQKPIQVIGAPPVGKLAKVEGLVSWLAEKTFTYKFKYLISSILCPKRLAQTLSTSLASKPAISFPRGGWQGWPVISFLF